MPPENEVEDQMTSLGDQVISGDEILRLRSEALDWLPVDNEVVALDGRQALYLGTNVAGAELWKALAEGTTRQKLVALLVDLYSIDRERAGHDVDRFLEALIEQSLLDR